VTETSHHPAEAGSGTTLLVLQTEQQQQQAEGGNARFPLAAAVTAICRRRGVVGSGMIRRLMLHLHAGGNGTTRQTQQQQQQAGVGTCHRHADSGTTLRQMRRLLAEAGSGTTRQTQQVQEIFLFCLMTKLLNIAFVLCRALRIAFCKLCAIH
jgi:hypothetical protein